MISKSEVGSIALDFDRRIRGMCCSEWNDCVRISELIAIGRFCEAFLGCADLIVNEEPMAAGRLRQLGSVAGWHSRVPRARGRVPGVPLLGCGRQAAFCDGIAKPCA